MGRPCLAPRQREFGALVILARIGELDDPRKVVVTASEAEILARVFSLTALSLSAFVDEALRRSTGS
ncbi:MAG: hypothetical protein ACYCXY_11710 [Acidimicrobiales bacterium]